MERKTAHLNNPDNSNVAPTEAGCITINCYTDPLCCWSWASQSDWERLRNEYKNVIRWNYIMGGMIPDWKNYADPVSSVSNPLQMGPVWMHASQVTKTPMHYSIWHEDPPYSSYPACIAVKSASLQSPDAANIYFTAVQEALMIHGRNIARTDALFTVAKDVAKKNPEDFNLDLFSENWENGKAQQAFRDDVKQARFHKIGRFPSLTITDQTGKGIITVGYRPYDALVKAFLQVYK